ncbi:MAG: phosphohistidine phosphatase SixA, partial [Methanoregulaceae archaeon]|nr:phosphohistidine phosphatase SixA [Methanoregulaceae archaeon]
TPVITIFFGCIPSLPNLVFVGLYGYRTGNADYVLGRLFLMDLYVLRHGKAEPSLPQERDDFDRALTRQGRDEIHQIVAWMLRRGCRFDMIATSPFKRAIETAEIIAETYGLRKNLLIWEELSPGMDFVQLMKQIESRRDVSSLLIIGHEPSLSGCIGWIISQGGQASLQLKKGGLARIRNFTPLPVFGELSWLIPPGHMRD